VGEDQNTGLLLGRRDIEIFTDLLDQEIKDLPVAGNGRDSPRGSVDVDAVIPALAEQNAPTIQ